MTSDVATLFIGTPLQITEQPQDIVAAVGTGVTLHVAAKGDGLSYQWQRSDDNGTTWWDCPSGKAADWTFMMFASYDGIPYRCIVSDSHGNSVTSDVATLTVGTPLQITEQPQNIAAAEGTSVTLHVAAKGDGLSYQWQRSDDNGATWWNCSCKTADWTFTMLASYNGIPYRCIVSDSHGNSVASNVVTLSTSSQIVSGDFVFDLTADGSGYYVKAYTGSAQDVTVPGTVNGKPVTEIGEEAFMGKEFLTCIDLPDSITVIRARAFKNCSNLSEMK